MEVGRDIDTNRFLSIAGGGMLALALLAAFLPLLIRHLFDRLHGWCVAEPGDSPLFGALRILIRTSFVCVVLMAGVWYLHRWTENQ